ncbi:Lactose transport system permease protein LacF [Actinomadura sp. RB99]|uniref:carbohydrate ABC transporter permease n=1 Tax=Actinomadura sp. RB99 TaxID=2691577 RepID=UPI001682CD01|nr:sugar ABC transporter permease [Actinomadura sp. RB99]MBD2892977.1 Lactose transport system permease protein LacF [Actinomadura sp. RB99]
MAQQTTARKPAAAARTKAPSARGRRRTSRTAPWMFAGPAAALFGVFFAYPLLAGLYQSFTADRDGVTTWVGLAQYRRMMHDPVFWTSMRNIALILVVQVPVMIALALAMAYGLNQSWLRFRATYRIACFLPAVTMLVAYSVVFRVLLKTDDGLVDQALTAVGLPSVDWLNGPGWARIALIGSITWRWTGYNAVILLAGLQGIGREQYEAAAIDGAGPATTFVRVVLPQLRPVVLFCLVTSTIGTLQLFDENYVLTKGGPGNATMSPVLYLYKVGFEQLDFGYAAAIAWVVVLIIGLISYAQFRFLGKDASR